LAAAAAVAIGLGALGIGLSIASGLDVALQNQASRTARAEEHYNQVRNGFSTKGDAAQEARNDRAIKLAEHELGNAKNAGEVGATITPPSQPGAR
jgi:hypothetical protein